MDKPTTPNPTDLGLLVPGTEEDTRIRELLEENWKATQADPELRQNNQKRNSDLQATYDRFSGRNPFEAGQQEELIRDARKYAESYLSEAQSPECRLIVSRMIWDKFIPNHPNRRAFKLQFGALHTAVWTEGNPSLEERANVYGADPAPDSESIIAKLPKEALIRIEAATAAFMAGYLPKLEREANRTGPIHDAELLRDFVTHQFILVARECMAVCDSVEVFEAELHSDIARFVHYGLKQYQWLADPMRKELETGFALFVMGANPWAEIPEKDRASVWHVGVSTGEALTHAALKLRAEAWKRAAEGGFSKANQAAIEPSEDESTGGDAGPAVNGTNPAKPEGKGRKRGPKPDHKAASRVAEIVVGLAPDGDWRPKLNDICEALDKAQIPFPPRWRKRDRSCDGWAAYDERANAVKAIEYRLEIAKQRKKTTPETLS